MAKLSQLQKAQDNMNNKANINSNAVNPVGTKRKRTRKTIPRDSPPQRSSIYRGVTRHRWTGRYEAHLWDKNCWNEAQNKKGRQVYLGAYDDEDTAAHAYDLAALKYWGHETILNFPLSTYEKELLEMEGRSREECIGSLRRKSSGFSRGVSKFRGVARHHHNGRWEARIGRVFGNKYLYLGTYATQEEAAIAYDMAAIEYRGLNAVTNFDLSRYINWLKPNNNNNEPNNNSSLISCPSHDSGGSVSLTPLGQPPDTTNNAATSHPQSTTSMSALGLLLRSSKFKEMMEMTLAEECSSTPHEKHYDPPQYNIPEDVKTCFESSDFCAYSDQGDNHDIFGDLNSFLLPMGQFDSILLTEED